LSNANGSPDSRFPSYEKPPVNEVLCGIRFEIPQGLKLPHIGLLWEKFRKEYPNIQHTMPIAASPNEFLIDIATGAPIPRVWFINRADNQLIQFQTDRLYFNWRQRGDSYPRYSNLIVQWEAVLNTVETFFAESEIGKLTPIECDLTYINHIEKGSGWESVDDLPNVFKDFGWKKSRSRFLPNPTAIGWEAFFPLPDKKGQLLARLRQGTRVEDQVPLLILEMIARGLGESKDRRGIREWFDTAHEWIVCGFADLTTDRIQTKVWRREHASADG
jgi:uncharacterized protein (TIGR04255 family)